jgi:hypothetical protein
LLALGACRAPAVEQALAPAAETGMAVELDAPAPALGTAAQLDAVAELARDVERAGRLEAQLDIERVPLARWMTRGALNSMVEDLQRRQEVLASASESRLVKVSLTAEVDPAIQALIEGLK